MNSADGTGTGGHHGLLPRGVENDRPRQGSRNATELPVAQVPRPGVAPKKAAQRHFAALLPTRPEAHFVRLVRIGVLCAGI